MLPYFLGNEMGEPVIEEREIRISDKPIKSRGGMTNYHENEA